MRRVSCLLIAMLLSGLTLPKAASADEVERSAVPSETLLQKVNDVEKFSTFVSLIRASGLSERLEVVGPLTVFVPTNEAFAKLPEGLLEELRKGEYPLQLASVLRYHMVPRELRSPDLLEEEREYATLEGDTLFVTRRDGTIGVNDAAVVRPADVDAVNGVIHAIDSVLIEDDDIGPSHRD